MRRTPKILLLLAVLIGATLSPLHGQAATDDERAAQAAAEAWLSLIDDEQYEESWNEAAEAFQGAVTAEQWAQQAETARQQVGVLEEREFAAAESATDPPQAPPGEYVILQYSSTFANVPSATETVATVKEADGSWKVTGYFVQPAN